MAGVEYSFTYLVKETLRFMQDSMFPIKIVADDTPTTAYAGLLSYLELWAKLGMPKIIDETVGICGSQGWTDRQVVLACVLLNLAGGDCVSDIDKLENDAGLCRMFRAMEMRDLPRRTRRDVERRFRAGRGRTFPAATQISTFLETCHYAEEEKKRAEGKAFIPQANDALLSLRGLNRALAARLQQMAPQTSATLDGDATLLETSHREALFCYKGYRAYQPYNVWWDEQQIVLHSEFRDGNVPAGHDIVRVMRDALDALPAAVKTIYTRQDTAAYQTDFLAWCEREQEHPEYGRILFTISADVTPDLRTAVLKEAQWTPMPGKGKGHPEREYTEFTFVPISHAKLSDIQEPFRFIAIRERLHNQLSLFENGEADTSGLPFPTLIVDNVCYKLHAIVTNRRDEDAAELIRWHYKRCGKSEEAHAVMKDDFTGGQMPSGKFGANAGWWALMILSMNLNRIIKGLMGQGWSRKRMKAIRFDLINQPGRVVSHARSFFLRTHDTVAQRLLNLREAILGLQPAPV